MDAEVVHEFRKAAASVGGIENRLASIEVERREAEMQTEFPPMLLPAFDQSPSSLPI